MPVPWTIWVMEGDFLVMSLDTKTPLVFLSWSHRVGEKPFNCMGPLYMAENHWVMGVMKNPTKKY